VVSRLRNDLPLYIFVLSFECSYKLAQKLIVRYYNTGGKEMKNYIAVVIEDFISYVDVEAENISDAAEKLQAGEGCYLDQEKSPFGREILEIESWENSREDYLAERKKAFSSIKIGGVRPAPLKKTSNEIEPDEFLDEKKEVNLH